jgi:hypothetical protein
MIICGRHVLCVYEYTYTYVQKQKTHTDAYNVLKIPPANSASKFLDKHSDNIFSRNVDRYTILQKLPLQRNLIYERDVYIP